jgi:hypothetical protein
MKTLYSYESPLLLPEDNTRKNYIPAFRVDQGKDIERSEMGLISALESLGKTWYIKEYPLGAPETNVSGTYIIVPGMTYREVLKHYKALGADQFYMHLLYTRTGVPGFPSPESSSYPIIPGQLHKGLYTLHMRTIFPGYNVPGSEIEFSEKFLLSAWEIRGGTKIKLDKDLWFAGPLRISYSYSSGDDRRAHVEENDRFLFTPDNFSKYKDSLAYYTYVYAIQLMVHRELWRLGFIGPDQEEIIKASLSKLVGYDNKYL